MTLESYTILMVLYHIYTCFSSLHNIINYTYLILAQYTTFEPIRMTRFDINDNNANFHTNPTISPFLIDGKHIGQIKKHNSQLLITQASLKKLFSPYIELSSYLISSTKGAFDERMETKNKQKYCQNCTTTKRNIETKSTALLHKYFLILLLQF